MTKSGKNLITEGEEMIEKGQSMVEQGHEMGWGETVVVNGHEMKKGEMRRRGKEMIERGREKVERGHELRKYDVARRVKKELRTLLREPKKALNFWSVLGNVPITVALVVGVSVWLVLEGITSTRITYGTLINPLYHIELLFVHSSWEHLLTNMYFFVPAGILLTYLTNNRKVFEVVAVSHVSAVLITGFAFDQSMTGTTAAAYGLLAATAVRAAYVGASSRRYSQKTQTAAPIGIFALSAVGMLMIGVVSGGLVQNVPLIVGFVAGGVLECLRVVSKTRGTSKGEMNEMDAIGTSSSR